MKPRRPRVGLAKLGRQKGWPKSVWPKSAMTEILGGPGEGRSWEGRSWEGRLVKDVCSSRCSEWNADEKWFSQEWKSDEVLETRKGSLANEQPPGLFTQQTNKFIVDDDDMDKHRTHNQTFHQNRDHSCTG